MVRFKDTLGPYYQNVLPMISIPLWCDLKPRPPEPRAPTSQISIPLWCDLKSGGVPLLGSLSQKAFHPTMVRFKVGGGRMPFSNKPISIPLWCDLKPTEPAGVAAAVPDFHPTMVRFKGKIARVRVAITRYFHPTMVRFKARRALCQECRICISIPLWCDLKFRRF